ncbi:MAG: hypothetical protein KDA41_00390, partial [Planctomycetales bacterium]|nr:hypothetical protein [Planctomycetales bacterium]
MKKAKTTARRPDPQSGKTAPRPSGTRGRMYLFAVVGLTVFLLAIVLGRQSPVSYTARVMLEADP